MKKQIPCVIAIAGSDSSGGAGVQADMKTFAALGVYGTCALTAITAQNTLGVSVIYPLTREVVTSQIVSVLEDIPVEFAKVGMVFSQEVIEGIAELIDKYKLKFVLDPVFRAGSGDSLIKEDAKKTLTTKLVPRTEVLTPNIIEAEDLAKMSIRNLDDMREAAEKITMNGVGAVLLKGGHLEGTRVYDLLLKDGKFRVFEKDRIKKSFHGTGCTLSSAITAFLAKGYDIETAVEKAEEFLAKATELSPPVGKGRVPVNQTAPILLEADRWGVLKNMYEAVDAVESFREIARFIPEVGTQIAMATLHARGPEDVAAVEGRIIRVRDSPKAVGRVWFGASRHLANIILTAMKYDENIRACMNLRYDPDLLEAFKKCGFYISSFDRKLEPPEVKSREGGTLSWGVNEAITTFGCVPDVVFDLGEVGKEPMIRVLGSSATEVLNKVKKAVKKSGNSK